MTCTNVIGMLDGEDNKLPPLVVGAHFDTDENTPGANDNGSGIAALLEIAREIKEPTRTLILAAFTNEEPPFFGTRAMGSWKLANELVENKTQIPRNGSSVYDRLRFDRSRVRSKCRRSSQSLPGLTIIPINVGNLSGLLRQSAFRGIPEPIL